MVIFFKFGGRYLVLIIVFQIVHIQDCFNVIDTVMDVIITPHYCSPPAGGFLSLPVAMLFAGTIGELYFLICNSIRFGHGTPFSQQNKSISNTYKQKQFSYVSIMRMACPRQLLLLQTGSQDKDTWRDTATTATPHQSTGYT